MAKEKTPDPVEEWVVEKLRYEFRRARSLIEKGLQQARGDDAEAAVAIDIKAKRDKATGDYELFVKAKSVKLPGDSHSEKVRLNHGRMEMIQGELPLEETSGLH